MKTEGRDSVPFVVRAATPTEVIEFRARAEIDSSGTWSTPNPLGANGLSVIGEAEASERIHYGIPDARGGARSRYAGKRVMVVGSGHSAANALLALAELAGEGEHVELIWAVRGNSVERAFGGGESDALPARGKLGTELRKLQETGRLELVKDFRVAAISRHEGKLTVHATGADGSKKGIEGVDEIICATGQRPNLEMTSELRLKLDPWLESAAALGPLIDPNVHSCGTVRPHGHRELSHPESGFYAIGVKSYGRAPTFLMTTGFEQARSLVAALAGDIESADRVELVLPETGVCSSHLGDDAGSCCGVGLAADVVSDEPARVESSQCCATVDRGRAIKIPVTSRACCG